MSYELKDINSKLPSDADYIFDKLYDNKELSAKKEEFCGFAPKKSDSFGNKLVKIVNQMRYPEKFEAATYSLLVDLEKKLNSVDPENRLAISLDEPKFSS